MALLVFFGVYHRKTTDKFIAQIGGKHIGIYNTAIEAAVAYNTEAEKQGYLTRNKINK